MILPIYDLPQTKTLMYWTIFSLQIGQILLRRSSPKVNFTQQFSQAIAWPHGTKAKVPPLDSQQI